MVPFLQYLLSFHKSHFWKIFSHQVKHSWWSLSFRFLHQNPAILCFHMDALCCAHHIDLYMINLIIFSEQYEIRKMLVQLYWDNAMKKTAVYKWVKRFSKGRESVTDEERPGWPATSRTEENIAKICQIVRENCRLTVRGIAEQVNIDTETVRKILTEDLDMRKVCAKMVPKELTH